MAVVRPFRAFRYDLLPSQSIEEWVAPLWELLTPELMASLYQRPDNAIHLSVPRSSAAAVETWREWKRSGQVARDPLPAFYPWFQRFSLFGSHQLYERKGFVAMARLNQPGESPDIIVHEDTLRPVVRERARFLAELPLHVTPVHGLYYDPDFEIEKRLEPYRENPLADLVDPQGVRHTMSVMQHPEDLRFVAERLKDRKIYLADGHHRLQTAEMYRDAVHAKGRQTSDAAEYVMMYLSNYAADDLRILPTHRLVELAAGFDEEVFTRSLEKYFSVSSFDSRTPLLDQIKRRRHSFGLLFGDTQLLIELKPDFDFDERISLPLPFSVKKLDYTLLHYLIIDRLLGVPYEAQNSDPRITYHKDFAAVHRAVHSEGGRRLGILVNEVSMDELLAVCADGARMPQKSTYFFPKIVSGLLFASIRDEDHDPRFDLGF